MPTLQGSADIIEQTSGASISGNATISGSATFVIISGFQFDGAGDTPVATLDSASADITYTAAPDGNTRVFWAGFYSPSTGASVPFEVTGGDAGDQWTVFVTGWTEVDSVTAWDATQADQSASTAIATDSDSVALGHLYCATDPTPGQTEIAEYQETNFNEWQSLQQAAGTGGNVTLSWTNQGTVYVASRLNLRHAAAAATGIYTGLGLLGVGT